MSREMDATENAETAEPSPPQDGDLEDGGVARGAHDPTDSGSASTKKGGFWKRRAAEKHRKKLEKEATELRAKQAALEKRERLRLEAEEKLSWDAIELPERNRRRLVQAFESREDDTTDTEYLQERGYFYNRGKIQSLQRYRDSPAKFRTYSGHRDEVFSVAVSDDQRHLLSASADGTLRLWDLESAESLQTFEGHTDDVRDCALCHEFEPDSSDEKLRLFVSGSRDRTLRVWRAGEENSFRVFECSSEPIYCVGIDLEGNVALSAGQDGCIRLWDIEGNHLRFIFRAHTSAILHCAYSPTGRYIVSSSDAGECCVKIWFASMPAYKKPRVLGLRVLWGFNALIKRISLEFVGPENAAEFLHDLDMDCDTLWDEDYLEELLNPGAFDLDLGDAPPDEEPLGVIAARMLEERSHEVDYDPEEELPDIIESNGFSLMVAKLDKYGKKQRVEGFHPDDDLMVSIRAIYPFRHFHVAAYKYGTYNTTSLPNSGARVGSFAVSKLSSLYRVAPDGTAVASVWQASEEEDRKEAKRGLHEFNAVFTAPPQGCGPLLLTATLQPAGSSGKSTDAEQNQSGDDTDDEVNDDGDDGSSGAPKIPKFIRLRASLRELPPLRKGRKSDDSVQSLPFDAVAMHGDFIKRLQENDTTAAVEFVSAAFQLRHHVDASDVDGDLFDVAAKKAVEQEQEGKVEGERNTESGSSNVDKYRTTKEPALVSAKQPESTLDTAAGDEDQEEEEEEKGPHVFEVEESDGERFFVLTKKDAAWRRFCEQLNLGKPRMEACAPLFKQQKSVSYNETRCIVVVESTDAILEAPPTPVESSNTRTASVAKVIPDEEAIEELLQTRLPDDELRARAIAELKLADTFDENPLVAVERQRDSRSTVPLGLLRQQSQAEVPYVDRVSLKYGFANYPDLQMALPPSYPMDGDVAEVSRDRALHLQIFGGQASINLGDGGLDEPLRSQEEKIAELEKRIKSRERDLLRIALRRRNAIDHRAQSNTTSSLRRNAFSTLPGFENFASRVALRRSIFDRVRRSGGFIRVLAPRRLHRRTTHLDGVNDAVFSLDERRVASASSDGCVCVWDTLSADLTQTLRGHKGAVTSVTFSHNSLNLASGGVDNMIVVWDLMLGTQLCKLRGHDDAISRVVFTKESHSLVSASADATLRSWYLTPRPPAAPLPPVLIRVKKFSVVATWSAPPSFNEEIIAFYLERRIVGENATAFGHRFTTDGRTFKRRVERLHAGTPYQFRVLAVNRMGPGEWSEPSLVTVTAFDVPEKPDRPLVANVGSTFLTVVWWTLGGVVAGAAVTEFTLQVTGDDELAFVPQGGLRVPYAAASAAGESLLSEQRRLVNAIPRKRLRREAAGQTEQLFHKDDHLLMSHRIHGLRPGYKYRVRVAATNPVGVSVFSEASYSTMTAPTQPERPDPPTHGQSRWREVTVVWTAPKDNGSAIERFKLFHVTEGVSATHFLSRTRTWFTAKDAAPGSLHYFRVQAFNACGASEVSEESEAIESPPGVPLEPSAPTVSSLRPSAAILKVVLPNNMGRGITKIFVQKRIIVPFQATSWSPAGLVSLDGNATTALVAQNESSVAEKDVQVVNLIPDTYHEFRVSACNECGESAWSAPSLRCRTKPAEPPPCCPAPPELLELLPNSFVAVWSAPEQNDSGSAIDGYVCEREARSSTGSKDVATIRTGREPRVRVEMQSAGVSVRVRVAARNSLGRGQFGPWSADVQLPDP